MHRLEQYCINHGWKINVFLDTGYRLKINSRGQNLVAYKNGYYIRRRFEIVMEIDDMIREMYIIDYKYRNKQLEFSDMVANECLF